MLEIMISTLAGHWGRSASGAAKPEHIHPRFLDERRRGKKQFLLVEIERTNP